MEDFEILREELKKERWNYCLTSHDAFHKCQTEIK